MSSQINFNSIKVQLKPPLYWLLYTFNSFQFHKGTIKTDSPLSRSLVIGQFQFHKGTIKTVRWPGLTSSRIGFQFHKGTIKTHRKIAPTSFLRYFNSIKVQLKLCLCNLARVACQISIP